VKNLFLKYWKSILFSLLILYLSFAKPDNFKELPTVKFADKWAHYVIYIVYGLTLIYDYYKANQTKFLTLKFVSICFVFPILMGGLIEILQERYFYPRSAEWLDWSCDIVGILTAWLVAWLLRLILKRK